jgi:hypothetical protein
LEVAPPELEELDEQLEVRPPAVDDILPEILEELELVAQLPELPLKPDAELPLFVLEELLQLNAFAKCNGVIPMMNIAVTAVMATVTNIGDFCILSLF